LLTKVFLNLHKLLKVKIQIPPQSQKIIVLLYYYILGFLDFIIQCKYIFNLGKNKTHKLYILGYLCTFIWVFCVITRVMRVFWNFHIFLNSLMLKTVETCSAHPSTWIASMSFKRRMWHHPMDITSHSLSSSMRHCVLFHLRFLEWRVIVYVDSVHVIQNTFNV
jgi:hypothetical protein